jgi:hypothetical protein
MGQSAIAPTFWPLPGTIMSAVVVASLGHNRQLERIPSGAEQTA